MAKGNSSNLSRSTDFRITLLEAGSSEHVAGTSSRSSTALAAPYTTSLPPLPSCSSSSFRCCSSLVGVAQGLLLLLLPATVAVVLIVLPPLAVRGGGWRGGCVTREEGDRKSVV